MRGSTTRSARPSGRWAIRGRHAASSRRRRGSTRARRYHVDVAGLLLDAGAPAAAVARLEQAVRLKPRSAEIRLLLAAALRRAGDVNGMAREYTEVRRLAPAGPLGEFARQALNERSVP